MLKEYMLGRMIGLLLIFCAEYLSTKQHVRHSSLRDRLVPDAGPIPAVQNLVCTVNTDCILNLQKINYRTRNSEYNPSKFCGVVMRIPEPKATAVILLERNMKQVLVLIIQKLGFQAGPGVPGR